MGIKLSNAFLTKLQMTSGNLNIFEDFAGTAAIISGSDLGGVVTGSIDVYAQRLVGGTESGQVIRYSFKYSSSVDTWIPSPVNNNQYSATLDYVVGEDVTVTITRVNPDNTTIQSGSIEVYQSFYSQSLTMESPSGKSNPYSFLANTTIDGGDSWTWTFKNVDDSIHGSLNCVVKENYT